MPSPTASPPTEVPITCTDLSSTDRRPPHTFTFSLSAESIAPLRLAATPVGWLYEPNAAVLKAGAYRTLAQQYDVDALHPNTHLYIGGGEAPRWDFPGRVFRLREVVGFSKSEMRPPCFAQTGEFGRAQLPRHRGRTAQTLQMGRRRQPLSLRLYLGRWEKSHPCSRENKKVRLQIVDIQR